MQKGPVRLEGSGRNPLITHEDECGHTGFVRGNAIWPDFCVLGPRGNRRCLGGQRLQALRPRLQPHTPLTRQPSKATQPLPQGPRAGRQGVVGFLWLVPCPFPLRGCSKHTPARGCANRRSKEEDLERKQQLWDCAGRPCRGPMRSELSSQLGCCLFISCLKSGGWTFQRPCDSMCDANRGRTLCPCSTWLVLSSDAVALIDTTHVNSSAWGSSVVWEGEGPRGSTV